MRSLVLFNQHLIESQQKQQKWDFLRWEQHQLLLLHNQEELVSVTVIKKVGIVKVVKMYAQMWHQKKGNVQDHAAGEDQTIKQKKPLSESTMTTKMLQLSNAISIVNLSKMFLVVILHQELQK